MIRGTDPAVVREALSTREPLPGTAGFAGALDGTLVRDVLGRQPVFVETVSGADAGHLAWSFDPEELVEPTSLPAGHAVSLDPAAGDLGGADDGPKRRLVGIRVAVVGRRVFG